MDSILKKIDEIIQKPKQEMGITVDSVTWEVEGKYNYLKIILDRDMPLDIDTIVDATNKISPLLDEYDLIDQEYILDISSKERND